MRVQPQGPQGVVPGIAQRLDLQAHRQTVDLIARINKRVAVQEAVSRANANQQQRRRVNPTEFKRFDVEDERIDQHSAFAKAQ